MAVSAAYSFLHGSDHHQWRPGLSRLPRSGLGALLLSLAGAVVAFVILAVSDGDAVESWRYQPTVYISIASTVTNVALTYALVEGVTIAWWNKALKHDTKVADLHRVWAFGHSFLWAILSGRHVNLVAVACVLVAISPVNGPLLQRATTIAPSTVESTQTLRIPAEKFIPNGFTGVTSSRGNTVSLLSEEFTPIARGYYNNATIPLTTSCVGVCRTKIIAAGFHVNCSSYQAPFNATYDPNGDVFPDPSIFLTQLIYAVGGAATSATLHVEYKPKPGEAGELEVRDCLLDGGSVEYPIVIDGSQSTISLERGTTVWSDNVIGSPDYLNGEDSSGQRSTYGGLFLAIANQITTNITMQFGGAINWEFFGTQSQASISYARNISGRPDPSIYFTDPTADFLESVRNLAFRTAIQSANETSTQQVLARATGLHNTYHTNYTFAVLATAVSLIAAVSVLATFHGFWHIGRKVSLSPVEVAKAFNAPLLRNADSNAPTGTLLKQIGNRPVTYGLVKAGPGGRKAVPRHDGSSGNVQSPYQDDFHNDIDEISTSTPYSQIPQRHAPFTDSPRSAWNSAITTGSQSDMELLSSTETRHASTSREWLELADPSRVTALRKGAVFKG